MAKSSMSSFTSFVDQENSCTVLKAVGTQNTKQQINKPSSNALKPRNRQALSDVSNKLLLQPCKLKTKLDTLNESGFCQSSQTSKTSVSDFLIQSNNLVPNGGVKDFQNCHQRYEACSEGSVQHISEEIEFCPHISSDSEDDFEDIWPKEQRLSIDQLDQLIMWQPCLSSPYINQCGTYDDDDAKLDFLPLPNIVNSDCEDDGSLFDLTPLELV